MEPFIELITNAGFLQNFILTLMFAAPSGIALAFWAKSGMLQFGILFAILVDLTLMTGALTLSLWPGHDIEHIRVLISVQRGLRLILSLLLMGNLYHSYKKANGKLAGRFLE